MAYQIVDNHGHRYLDCVESEFRIRGEDDALDLVALCVQHDTYAVLLNGQVLSEEFVRLRTGIAGAVLQKLAHYNIRAAIVVAEGVAFPERFEEMLSEYRKGNRFGVFNNVQEAQEWFRS